MTYDECIANAEEAEELAGLVGLEQDRIRLHRLAAGWRERAGFVVVEGVAEQPPITSPGTPMI